MVIINAKIVLVDRVIDNGFVVIETGLIKAVKEGKYAGNDDVFDAEGKVLMPGFIDVHVHGSCGIDFMDANVEDYKTISQSMYEEGVTTFLATTLTSGIEAMLKVARTVKEARKCTLSATGR